MRHDLRRSPCDDAMGKLWEYLDAELSGSAARMVAVHLGSCEPCRARMVSSRRLLTVVKTSDRGVRAPARLRERVLAARFR